MKLPQLFKNFYFLVGTFFVIWMVFIDSNDFITQIRLQNELNNLNSEKEYYIRNIDEVEEMYDSRNNDPQLLEKYAREKYLMKKDGEDIFIIVEKEQ